MELEFQNRSINWQKDKENLLRYKVKLAELENRLGIKDTEQTGNLNQNNLQNNPTVASRSVVEK